jgi:Icc-related predicted phosphoesterase
MKILAFGDIHGDSRLAEKLAERADKENVDLVVLCGDITYNDQQPTNLLGPFVKRHKKVLLVPGNHESVATADFLAQMYGVKNLHGYSVTAGDVGLFGCGGANIGINQIEEKEILGLLRKSYKGIEKAKKKIMVTHVHPSGTTIEKFSKLIPGSDGVRKAVDELKPDILLCSHVHEAEGLEEKVGKTRVINVGKEGKIINI